MIENMSVYCDKCEKEYLFWREKAHERFDENEKLKSLNEELVKRNENLIECLREILRIWQEHPKLSPNYQLNWKVRDLIGQEALTQDSAKSGWE